MARFHRQRMDGVCSRPYRQALDVVCELEDLTIAIVPKAPSEDMIDAGAEVGGVARDSAEKIYRAMIEAAGRIRF